MRRRRIVMTTRQTRKYEMLQRVHTFGLARRDQFPAESLSGEAFRAVGVAVAELARHAASKVTTLNEGLRAKRETRRTLVERLKAMARCARAIEVTSPGFSEPAVEAAEVLPPVPGVTPEREVA